MPPVSELPDQAPAAAAPLTRRELREAASRRRFPRRVYPPGRLTVLTTVAFAGLVALTGFAGPTLVAVAVALGGFVVAWGWPILLNLPSPRGTTGVLAAGTVLMAAAVIVTPNDPFLRWVPAALAVSVVIAFLHQLLRRDGRPRLTESVAATTSGLAIISSGVALAPLPHVLNGAPTLAAAMAGLGVGALADPLIGARRGRQWALFIAMVLGGSAAVGVALVAGHPRTGAAGLLGLMAAGVSHAARRILAVLPSAGSSRAQLALASSSAMLVGVVAYVLVRRFVA
jgi:hypothetical protein